MINKKIFIKFNKFYNLPVNNKPTLLPVQRLKNFKQIFFDEVLEAEDIIALQEEAFSKKEKIEALTELADWFGDIIWYVQSEAIKYGLDMDKILNIIKESNFSKLGKNNKPIYDKRGKVLKGSGYIKPQDKIRKYIESKSIYTSLV